MKYLMTMLLLVTLNSLYGQKTEREYRLKEKEVPEKATEWLEEAYEDVRKVKWHFEKSMEDESYEAKFKWKKYYHSVEFNLDGEIEDIEIRMGWNDLPKVVKENLTNYFENEYSNYHIDKIQLQLLGTSEELEDLIEDDDFFESDSHRYEIEFYGKNDLENDMWEGTFTSDGNLISKRKIILRPADNLSY